MAGAGALFCVEVLTAVRSGETSHAEGVRVLMERLGLTREQAAKVLAPAPEE